MNNQPITKKSRIDAITLHSEEYTEPKIGMKCPVCTEMFWFVLPGHSAYYNSAIQQYPYLKFSCPHCGSRWKYNLDLKYSYDIENEEPKDCVDPQKQASSEYVFVRKSLEEDGFVEMYPDQETSIKCAQMCDDGKCDKCGSQSLEYKPFVRKSDLEIANSDNYANVIESRNYALCKICGRMREILHKFSWLQI